MTDHFVNNGDVEMITACVYSGFYGESVFVILDL